MTESTPPVNDIGEARFKWRTLALWSLIFAIVSLIALAVVATINQADTLSVVALALAVLAFVVQIIVFIVQGLTSSQQAADTAALNAQTLRALATIEEKSEGTRETVVKMNDRLFAFAFNKASLEAESSDAPQPALKVLERTKEIIDAKNIDVTKTQKPVTKDPLSSPAVTAESEPPTQPLLDAPLTGGEIEEVELLLESLNLTQDLLPAIGLSRLGQDLLAAEQAGRAGQAGMVAINGAETLHRAGLIRRVRVDWSNYPYFILSDKGRLAAKALLINPAPISEKIIFWRRKVEDFEARMARSLVESQRKTDTIPIDE